MAASSSQGIPAAIGTSAREPNEAEYSGMESLADIFTWARVKGSADNPVSQMGSLLLALGADDDITIEEFASIPVANFTRVIEDV